MDLDKITAAGEKLGYSGEELKNFVKVERDIARDERAAQRASDKQMLEMQLEIENMRKENAASGVKHEPLFQNQNKAKMPKLPEYREEKDDIDAYLQRFERYADSNKWKKEDWALNLSALLHGKGLDTYCRLSPNEANNYDLLKPELLKAYQLTEDGFRSKFKEARPEKNESAPQFTMRIANYLQRWIDLSSVQKSFPGLVDLLLRDQFLVGCSRDMALFLRERKPKNIDHMTQLAEQYSEARGGWYTCTSKSGHSEGQVQPSDKNLNPVVSAQNTSARQSNDNSTNTRRCFKCDRVGHTAKNCYSQSKSSSSSSLKAASLKINESQVSKYGKSVSDVFCTSCPCVSCIRVKGKNIASTCKVLGQEVDVDNMESGGVVSDDVFSRSDGHEVLCASAACSSNPDGVSKMPIVKGFIGTKEVKVLRDSGCGTVAVSSSLVSEENLTGEFNSCLLIDGTVRKFPVAHIEVDTPFYTGRVDALVMTKPVYDLILGNIPGVLEPGHPDPDWKPRCQPPDIDVLGAFQTRSQKEKPAGKNKKYYHREDVQQPIVVAGLLQLTCISVIKGEAESMSNEHLLQIPSLQETETIDDVHINSELTGEQRQEVKTLLGNYKDVLTDVIGCTDLGSHNIKLTDDTPIRRKPFEQETRRDTESIFNHGKGMLGCGVGNSKVRTISSRAGFCSRNRSPAPAVHVAIKEVPNVGSDYMSRISHE